MRSAFAFGYGATAFARGLPSRSSLMCPASEGWTTDMFVEAIYNGVKK